MPREHWALPLLRPVIALLQRVNARVRQLAYLSHRAQGMIEGHFDRRRLWFDHYVDVHWRWHGEGDGSFLERGIFNRALIGPGARVLELACGDGFNARYFYARAAAEVTAIDIDASAIEFARRYNGAQNIRYLVGDVREKLPEGPFDHVIWDGAMAMLTEEDLVRVLGELRERLGTEGVLSGYAPVESRDPPFVHRKFSSREDLEQLLGQVFAHVRVIAVDHPARIEYYFFASDAPVKLGVDPTVTLQGGAVRGGRRFPARRATDIEVEGEGATTESVGPLTESAQIPPPPEQA